VNVVSVSWVCTGSRSSSRTTKFGDGGTGVFWDGCTWYRTWIPSCWIVAPGCGEMIRTLGGAVLLAIAPWELLEFAMVPAVKPRESVQKIVRIVSVKFFMPGSKNC
jgi:hypothetical protein